MVIWRGPALMITVINAAIFVGLMGFGLLHKLLGVQETTALTTGAGLTGLGMAASDLYLRLKIERIQPFDLSRSTFFFVIPTWIIGVLVSVFASYALVSEVLLNR